VQGVSIRRVARETGIEVTGTHSGVIVLKRPFVPLCERRLNTPQMCRLNFPQAS